MGWKGIVRLINQLASKAKDVDALTSGNPKKIALRVRNKVKTKAIAKSSFWKW